jgi:hypothetical protein
MWHGVGRVVEAVREVERQRRDDHDDEQGVVHRAPPRATL